MPEYLYEAKDKEGKKVIGIIAAQSELYVHEKLVQLGYQPVKITEGKKKATELDLWQLLSKYPIIKLILAGLGLFVILLIAAKFFLR
jgi:type II secretory pathway component PulF